MVNIANHQRNANQNHNEIATHTFQNGYHQKEPQIKNVCEDVDESETSYTVGGNVNWYRHCGKQYGSLSRKLEIELPYDPAIPLLDMYPPPKKKEREREKSKNIKLKRYMYPNVHSSIIYTSQDMEAAWVH